MQITGASNCFHAVDWSSVEHLASTLVVFRCFTRESLSAENGLVAEKCACGWHDGRMILGHWICSPKVAGLTASQKLLNSTHMLDAFVTKISTLVYRSLAGTAPVYLADECMLVTAAGRRPLRSADNRTCLVKRSRNQFDDRCFATAGPTLSNSLPEQLRQPDITFGQFKLSLKTFVWLVGPWRFVSER